MLRALPNSDTLACPLYPKTRVSDIFRGELYRLNGLNAVDALWFSQPKVKGKLVEAICDQLLVTARPNIRHYANDAAVL